MTPRSTRTNSPSGTSWPVAERSGSASSASSPTCDSRGSCSRTGTGYLAWPSCSQAASVPDNAACTVCATTATGMPSDSARWRCTRKKARGASAASVVSMPTMSGVPAKWRADWAARR